MKATLHVGEINASPNVGTDETRELPDAERRFLNLPGDAEPDLVEDLLSVGDGHLATDDERPAQRGRQGRAEVVRLVRLDASAREVIGGRLVPG